MIRFLVSYAVLRARKVRLLFCRRKLRLLLPLGLALPAADLGLVDRGLALGNAIGRANDPRPRKLWLIGTVVLNPACSRSSST